MGRNNGRPTASSARRLRWHHSGCGSMTESSYETAMSDDPKKTGLDRRFISLEEPYEVRSWTESLGCTEEQLRNAVAEVGHSAEQVRIYLKKK